MLTDRRLIKPEGPTADHQMDTICQVTLTPNADRQVDLCQIGVVFLPGIACGQLATHAQKVLIGASDLGGAATRNR
jgi:hypothetical protein